MFSGLSCGEPLGCSNTHFLLELTASVQASRPLSYSIAGSSALSQFVALSLLTFLPVPCDVAMLLASGLPPAMQSYLLSRSVAVLLFKRPASGLHWISVASPVAIATALPRLCREVLSLCWASFFGFTMRFLLLGLLFSQWQSSTTPSPHLSVVMTVALSAAVPRWHLCLFPSAQLFSTRRSTNSIATPVSLWQWGT